MSKQIIDYIIGINYISQIKLNILAQTLRQVIQNIWQPLQQSVVQQKANQQKAVKQIAVQQKAIQQKAVQQKAVLQKSVLQKAVQQKADQQKAVQQKIIQQKVTQQQQQEEAIQWKKTGLFKIKGVGRGLWIKFNEESKQESQKVVDSSKPLNHQSPSCSEMHKSQQKGVNCPITHYRWVESGTYYYGGSDSYENDTLLKITKQQFQNIDLCGTQQIATPMKGINYGFWKEVYKIYGPTRIGDSLQERYFYGSKDQMINKTLRPSSRAEYLKRLVR